MRSSFKERHEARILADRAAKYRRTHPLYKMLMVAQQRAYRNAIPFNIEQDDIRTSVYCPYLGHKLTYTVNNGRVKTNALIGCDNLVKGYIPGNVRLMSDQAVQMKGNATPEELVIFAWNILRLHKDTVAQLEAEERERAEKGER